MGRHYASLKLLELFPPVPARRATTSEDRSEVPYVFIYIETPYLGYSTRVPDFPLFHSVAFQRYGWQAYILRSRDRESRNVSRINY